MKLIISAFLILALAGTSCSNEKSLKTAAVDVMTLTLPAPKLKSTVSLEETLEQRRSVREYSGLPLALADISQLLWSAQGITADWGGRTAPSAGGLYPLEVYLAAGKVTDISAGVYKYKPSGHQLVSVRSGDVRQELSGAALGQSWVGEGAAVIVIAAVYERTTGKYGDRGNRYVDMEAGHAAQNLCLQATALKLGAVTIGAFHDNQVKSVMEMPDNEVPLYVIPVGREKS